MQLCGIKKIRARIILKSGLHIGAGDMEMKIGGTDNPVIKHPHTNEPYIPGSSLKGKVRSLLEMRSGLMEKTDGEPLSIKHMKELEGEQKQECARILKLFGAGAGEAEEKEAKELGPTRVSFADCALDNAWKDKAEKDFLSFIEVKSENTINRITGTALNPRFTERVPANTEFEFSVGLKIFDEDEDLEDFLIQGLKLLEMDALGGSGSRGYGRIEFVFLNEDNEADEDFNKKFRQIKPLGYV